MLTPGPPGTATAQVTPLPVMALVTGFAEYQVRVLRGLARQLELHGIPLLVVAHEPVASDRTPTLVLDLIRRHKVRGAIALADASNFHHPELSETLLRTGTPTVTLGHRLADSPVVRGDAVTGMRELMHHLLDDCGVRRPVLVLGIPDHVDSIEREGVFRAEMAQRDIAIDEELVIVGGFRPSEAYDALNVLLGRTRDIDAVVALNDMSAFGALSALTDHGLLVPQDVLLAGFDNTNAAETTWPPLSTIDAELEDQGSRAVDLLLQRIDNLPGPVEAAIPSRLVIRASTQRTGDAIKAELYEFSLQALQNQVALQDAAAYLSSSLSNCRTLRDVLVEIEPRLRRLGLKRCFLAIGSPGPASGAADSSEDVWCSLALSYRKGMAEPPSSEVFARHELLPPSLQHELGHGVLLLQTLSIGGRERGYLLFEPVEHSYLLTEAVRVDLPRTVDFVLSWQEMRDHSAMLEKLVAQRTHELEQANAELNRAVLRDGLTGAANRLAFDQHLEACAARAGDHGYQVIVLMIDVDFFKPFNDRYGHLVGDDALRTVASCLLRAAREPEDLVCRYGGEEFAIVLSDTSIKAALAVARRFHVLLSQAAIPHEASSVSPVVTASIGVASTSAGSGTDISQVVAAADQALYQAKAQGRNTTVLAGPGTVVPGQTRTSPSHAAKVPAPAHTPTGWPHR